MKTLTFIKYLFFCVGLGLLIGSIYWYQNVTSFIADANLAQGTVVDVLRFRTRNSITFRPVIHFNTKNEELIEFTSTTGSNPASYSVGEKVEILYNTSEPHKARIVGFFSLWAGPMILGILGSIFFLVGGGMFLASRIKIRRKEYLKLNGTPVATKFQRIELNKGLTVNGRHPFRIITQWQNTSTSELHIFMSENLWFDPTDHIKDETITVIIDRTNPKKYYMDISFLPKVAS
jgi:hypothetical protein